MSASPRRCEAVASGDEQPRIRHEILPPLKEVVDEAGILHMVLRLRLSLGKTGRDKTTLAYPAALCLADNSKYLKLVPAGRGG